MTEPTIYKKRLVSMQCYVAHLNVVPNEIAEFEHLSILIRQLNFIFLKCFFSFSKKIGNDELLCEVTESKIGM